MNRVLGVFVLALLVGAAGCLEIDRADGLLACIQNGKACPENYYCDSTNHCVQNGHGGGGGDGDGGIVTGDGGGGTGSQDNGAACTVGGDCKSTVCADGVCCDRACDGQCEACGTGTCSYITGQPSPPKALCNGSGACSGTCDGTSADCSYPTTGTICGATCDGTCDGNGNCNSTSGGSCPNGFSCGTTGCKTTCASSMDCQTNFACDTGTGQCNRVPEADCLNGVDDNGDGLADCADPTCNGIVECELAPDGAELGLHITSGTCPTGYTVNTETYHSNITNTSCSGSACTCGSVCTVTYDYDENSASCNLAVHSVSVTGKSGVDCVGVEIVGGESGKIASGNGTMSCSASGGSLTAPTTMSTTDTYCVAKTSATCDTTHVCVAKPASGTVCARVAAGGSCPTGYTGSMGTYYGSVTPASCVQASCAAASCSTTGYTCVVESAFLTTAACGTGTQTAVSTTCGTLSSSTTYFSFSANMALNGSENCKINPTTTAASGASPTMICCQ